MRSWQKLKLKFALSSFLAGSDKVVRRLYWKNSDSDNDANNDANWDLDEAATPANRLPSLVMDAYFKDTVSSDNCTLSDALAAKNISSVGYTGNHNIGTHECIVAGRYTVGGTITIGNSGAGNGLVVNGLTFLSGCSRDWDFGSIVNCSGNWIEPNTNFSVNARRGVVTITNSIAMQKPNANNTFYAFILNSGCTITAGADCITTSSLSSYNTINGVFNCSTYKVSFAQDDSDVFTVGVNGDFQGTGNLVFDFPNGITFTNNRVSAFSFSGTVRNSNAPTDNLIFPAWDFSNADVLIYAPVGMSGNRYFSAGTLKCKDLSIDTATGYTVTVNNSNNTSFEASENIDLNLNSGILAWTRGSGAITLPGGSANCNFDGQTIEELIVTGATKTITGAFTTAALTVPGNLNLNNIACTVEGDLNGDGTISSPSPVNLTVGGANNFTGTLTNVTIV